MRHYDEETLTQRNEVKKWVSFDWKYTFSQKYLTRWIYHINSVWSENPWYYRKSDYLDAYFFLEYGFSESPQISSSLPELFDPRSKMRRRVSPDMTRRT